MEHPRDILLGAQGTADLLPVCDHYSGVEARMVKSLQLQAEMMEEFGVCVFDVTLDCEDGAPVGGEVDQANMVCALANSANDASNLIADGLSRRVGARLHAVDHPAFASDVAIVVGGAAQSLSYVMLPKVESLHDVHLALEAIDAAVRPGQCVDRLPLHVLIESPRAVHRAFEIAEHPRVQSLSFGLMDFVSAHGGAISHTAMGVRAATDGATLDQFHHPLVVRAKLDIASACHASGKVPSHCVVTELRDASVVERAARTAAGALGYTRMWSIHPGQIRPILRAFTPSLEAIEMAARIVEKASREEWAPISVDGKLHDRASFRYFWQVLERAHQTGCEMPGSTHAFFPSRVH
ncbi:MAG: aldolase/citrate lyase family protein [Rhodoferax sp.]|nr:aldolase/citrate lyase family protein [Rhodoferax sp.]